MQKLIWLGGLILGLTLSGVSQDYPKAEVFGGYSYMRSSIAGTGFNFNGGSGSISVNPNHWLGIVGDFGVYHSSTLGIGDTTVTYLFGPKLAYRHNERVTPYVHVLFGGAHASISVGGSSGSVNAFAFALGGGVDAKLTHAVAFRVAQFDYLLTKFSDGIDDRQNNVRISTGIVFRWGGK